MCCGGGGSRPRWPGLCPCGSGADDRAQSHRPLDRGSAELFNGFWSVQRGTGCVCWTKALFLGTACRSVVLYKFRIHHRACRSWYQQWHSSPTSSTDWFFNVQCQFANNWLFLGNLFHLDAHPRQVAFSCSTATLFTAESSLTRKYLSLSVCWSILPKF